MFENYQIPANFHKVEVSEVEASLRRSGVRNAIYFFTNDVIVCSDVVLSVEREGSDKKMHTIPYLVVSVNGVEQAVPFGSFRRFPRDIDAFLAKSEIARALYHGDDYDRFNFLKGKTLKVVSLAEGEAIDFDKSDLATRNFVYKPAKFPIFELVK